MNTLSAFIMGELNRNREPMVFDWNKAAELIKDRNPSIAIAGLRADWEWTSGTIYENGSPVLDSYTFLASTWAVPEIDLDGEIIPCYKMLSEVPNWDSDTKWPQSALNILKGKMSND